MAEVEGKAALLQIIDVEPGLPYERTGNKPERDDKVVVSYPLRDRHHGSILSPALSG